MMRMLAFAAGLFGVNNDECVFYRLHMRPCASKREVRNPAAKVLYGPKTANSTMELRGCNLFIPTLWLLPARWISTEVCARFA
jgi:hypothetical protein